MRRALIAFMLVSAPLAAAIGAVQAPIQEFTAGTLQAGQRSSPVVSFGVELSTLNRAVDPCADFYQFACGGWIASHGLAADRRNYGRVQEIRDRNDIILWQILERSGLTGDLRKASDYFAACSDTAAIEARGVAPLRPELERIDHITSRTGLPELLAHLHSVAAANPPAGVGSSSTFPFFQMVARSDPARGNTLIAWVRANGLGLPDRDSYTKTDDRSVQVRRDYLLHVARMLVLAGAPPNQADASADAVLRIETALADAMLDAVARRDPDAVRHSMTFVELQALTPGFDWKRYVTARRAPGFDRLNVAEPKYVERIERLLADAPLDDIKSYLRWHVTHSAAAMLPRAFVDADFDFFSRRLLGQREQQPRWLRCLNQTDEHLGDALGRAFVNETFRGEAKADILAMIRNLKAALRKDIDTASWMSDVTKRAAIEKLGAVGDRIGYPDSWHEYRALQIAPHDAFGNLQHVRAAENARDLAGIGDTINPDEWIITPPTVNSYYSQDRNTINFPAGILQPPFYQTGRDQAVNYGAAGSLIGHELTHGFDDAGRKFDARGNLRDWWTPADTKAFDERAACIANQYSEYVVSADAHINGRLTLGENTADSGGVRLALMAYLSGPGATPQPAVDGFAPEQRVFLGFAQTWCESATPEYERAKTTNNVHAANQYRVNGVVSNMPEFQRAFSCRAGAPMVRANTCRVW